MAHDLIVVGAGILGLAHALAAVRIGKRVAVVERDAQANGASIRNFGFVTVNGQQAGDCWLMAGRARMIWERVVRDAKIDVLQRGMLVTARRPEAEAVIHAFLATDMAEGCVFADRFILDESAPYVHPQVTGALYSDHEIRVESRTALPQIARWLAEAHGVDFFWSTAVHAVEAPRVITSRGEMRAEAVVVCPGDDYLSLFPERIAEWAPTRCKLHMLRVKPERPFRLKHPTMSDLGLARYLGYAELPEAAALAARLDAEQPEHRANGVHLIVVQSADGSLVVGDSHLYGPTPDPFQPQAVDDLILQEMDAALNIGPWRVTERWVGTYASRPDGWRMTDAPDPATRIVIVTAGCGASTAFAIGEETIEDLFG
jgi:FAD dependent oxidoreductase TIGR03364